MIDINSFEKMEGTQSHTFINFSQGVPYTTLGWSSYKKFNKKMNDILLKVKDEFDVDVYLQEYEDINIAENFYWIYSFSVNEKDILININSFIKSNINDVMNCFLLRRTMSYTLSIIMMKILKITCIPFWQSIIAIWFLLMTCI